MRRVLTVAALGLLWTQAVWAQGELAPFGEDYAPADPGWAFPLGSTHPIDGGHDTARVRLYGNDCYAREQQAKVFLAKIISRIPDIRSKEGGNIDGSVLEQVIRGKEHLSLENMFSPKEDELEETQMVRPGIFSFPREAPYLDILNALYFLDALSPLALGPDMGPIFREPPETSDKSINRYFGYFR